MIPFISAEDLSAYLSTETHTVTLVPDDLIVLIALDGACQAVRDELNRSLNLSEEIIEIHDGWYTNSLVLKNRPIIEVTEVKIDDELVDLGDIAVYSGAGIIKLNNGTRFTRGYGNVSVTYSAGYALGEMDVTGDIVRVPASIRLVALKLAAAIWRSRGPDATGGNVTEEHIGTYQYRIQVGTATELAQQHLTDEDRRMIAGHRTAVIA